MNYRLVSIHNAKQTINYDYLFENLMDAKEYVRVEFTKMPTWSKSWNHATQTPIYTLDTPKTTYKITLESE